MLREYQQRAKTGERQQILKLLQEAEGETLTTAAIANATGKRGNNISHLLKRLAEEGLVENPVFGKWRCKSHLNYSNRPLSQSRKKITHVFDGIDINAETAALTADVINALEPLIANMIFQRISAMFGGENAS